MQQLTVFLKIPFDSESPIDPLTSMTFTHWLPVGRDHGVAAEDGDCRVLLWFDEKCTSVAAIDELKRYQNLNTYYVYVDIQVRGLGASLLEYMQASDSSKLPNEEGAALQLEYSRIARSVLTSAIDRVNRLIAFARSHKGQFWLSEYKIDFARLRSYFSIFEGRGQVDDGPIFRFQPSQTDVIYITTEGVDRYITESDWPEFSEFVIGGSKPQLIGELLAGSEHLLSIGHYRSAITEAVTALEVAVFRFAGNPNAERVFAQNMAQRLALSSLKSQIEHLGLSATINYLLPIILPEELLPRSVISECQFAISRRQTIVHNGQRSVSETDARRAVSGIRECCKILNELTDISA